MPHFNTWLPYIRLSGLLFLFTSVMAIIANALVIFSPQNFAFFQFFVLTNLLQFAWAVLGILILYRVLRHTRAGFFYDIALIIGVFTLLIWSISHVIVIVWPLSFIEQIQLFENKRFTNQDWLQQILLGLLFFALFWLGISLSLSNMLKRMGVIIAILAAIILLAMLVGVTVTPIIAVALLAPLGIGLLSRQFHNTTTSQPIGELPS